MTRIGKRLTVALLIAVAIGVAVTASAQSAGRILVMPFDNVRRDNKIIWLGEAASVLLTDALSAAGQNPITRAERIQAFERMQVPPSAALTDATVIRIGQIVAAERVVSGTVQTEGETLVVRLRSVALESGRVQADVTERGPLTDLYPLFERLAQRIEPSMRPSSGNTAAKRPPVVAFENYIKGLLAETPETAIAYLNMALKAAPGYDRATLALWDVYTDQGDSEHALSVLASIAADSPNARRGRFLAGLSQLDLDRYNDAFTTFRQLADAQPDPAVLNNLGVVQLHRPQSASAGVPTYFFTKATESDPDDQDYTFNLGYAYWVNHDAQAAIYWLREAVRRRPTDGVAHYVLGAALAATGNTREAAREKELARRLSSEFSAWDKRPATDPVPKDLERIKDDVELPHARTLEAKLTTGAQQDQQELARFYLESGRRAYEQENDREAVAELNRALYLSPYLPDAHLLLGRIHLRNGRVHEAMDALQISLWSAETADAHAVLGEAYRQDKNLDAARAEADRALVMDPASAEAKALIARLDGR